MRRIYKSVAIVLSALLPAEFLKPVHDYALFQPQPHVHLDVRAQTIDSPDSANVGAGGVVASFEINQVS